MNQTMPDLAKKIAKNKEDKAKEKAKKVKLAKRILIAFAFIILVSLMVKAIDKTVIFFRENTIVKYPIVKIQFHAPLEIVSLAELQRRELENQVYTELAHKVIEEYLHPSQPKQCETKTQIDTQVFFDTLRQKESSMGKNENPVALHNYCKNKGKWNEIGYNPQAKFCFKDEEEARLYVAYYVKKNCDGKTQAQCECFWNTGDMTDSCHYSNNELSLAN